MRVSRAAWRRATLGALVFVGATCAQAFAGPPLLIKHPTLSRTEIAFELAGSVYVVPRAGGTARLLVRGREGAGQPVFSPDGRQIAYTASVDGNIDVYVVDAQGGEPRRLTWHPGADEAVGWTPDGRQVVFRSMRESPRDLPHLFAVDAGGGVPVRLPLPSGVEASYAADGRHVAYVPFPQWQPAWKQYRGGQTTRVWVADLNDSSVVRVPRENSNDRSPAWLGDRVYFLSDREGPVTLYAYDVRERSVRRLVDNARGPDLTAVAAGPDALVYAQFGSLHLYDPASGTDRAVPVTVADEWPAARPHFVKLQEQPLLSAALSPTGKRAVFEVHGEIVSVPAEKGDVRNLTRSPGVADRDPSWSPDGRSVAWFTDESGEYELAIGAADGLSAPRRIPLGTPPSYFYGPRWSPDGKRIAYTDKRLNLWVVDLAKPVPVKVDTDRYDMPSHRFDPAWSADGRWLAYTKLLPNHLHAVFVWSVADGRTHQLTDGLSDAVSPQFDRDGKYLYFAAGTDVGLGAGWLDMSSLGRAARSHVYAMVLRADLPSPVAPESDEEPAPATPAADARGTAAKAKTAPEAAPAAPEVRIDFTDLSRRIVALPIPPARYTALAAGKAGVLFAVAEPVALADEDYLAEREAGAPVDVTRFDLASRKAEPYAAGIDDQTLRVSADGTKVLFGKAKKWFIVDADKAPKEGDGALKLEAATVWVDPRAEWRQIYHEAWRIERDFLYDPKHHGVDLAAAERAYAPFVDGLGSRGDLNVLLEEMTGHLSLGHTFVRGGESPPATPVSVGLLGADFRAVGGHVQFSRVLAGESWSPSVPAPLQQPGAEVRAGEFLLAVDGRPVDASSDVFRHIVGLAGRQVTLTVGPNADGRGARTVRVVPTPNDAGLRLQSWIDANRRYVDERTGGKVAYVYLPDTAFGGFANFNRYYFSQVGKVAAILDERFNHGGSIADYIVDQLKRTPQMINRTREGEDMIEPAQSIFGPKVMIVNQMSGSGGDALPWLFKKAAVGPLIGVRTWGGLVGIGGYPPLIDGGSITAPRWAIFGTQGAWEVENIGIPPDIEVEQDPALMRDGADPQLDRAIEEVLERMKKTPGPTFIRPDPPNVHPVIPTFKP
jgi:tricorn protease